MCCSMLVVFSVKVGLSQDYRLSSLSVNGVQFSGLRMWPLLLTDYFILPDTSDHNLTGVIREASGRQ